MLQRSLTALTAAVAFLALPVQAADYQFDVLYMGNNMAGLSFGSDDPDGTVLSAGDSFEWNITAQGADFWTVVTGGGFFPLMAFGTQEPGYRIGDYTLTLWRSGGDVFSTSEFGASNSFVHVGTNSIVLDTGLQFDRMQLVYQLTEAHEDPDEAEDFNNPLPIDTTLVGRLPIFGAPEMNLFSPGIIYGPVPEPSAWMLLAAGLLATGWRLRQQQRR